MYPPIFKAVSASPGVTSALGQSPVRFYPFGEAPQGVALPYSTWQVVSGAPENFISSRPDMDRFLIQVDVYGASADDVRDASGALRDAIEERAYITAWRGESREDDTGHYRFSFDVEWHVPRPA